jgi:hypothetical protein
LKVEGRLRIRAGAAILVLATAFLLTACYRNAGVSPGREEALRRHFSCDALGTIPTGVNAVFARHGMRARERRDSPHFYLAAAELGTSEFAVQVIGPDASIVLYTARGVAPTGAEAAILEEVAGAFAACRATPQILD